MHAEPTLSNVSAGALQMRGTHVPKIISSCWPDAVQPVTPMMQLATDVAPRVTVVVPDGHVRHTEAAIALTSGLYVPSGHCMHDAEPLTGE